MAVLCQSVCAGLGLDLRHWGAAQLHQQFSQQILALAVEANTPKNVALTDASECGVAASSSARNPGCARNMRPGVRHLMVDTIYTVVGTSF